MVGAYFACSSRTKVANSSGEVAEAVALCFANALVRAGSLSAATDAAGISFRMSGGVRAGATTPYQLSDFVGRIRWRFRPSANVRAIHLKKRSNRRPREVSRLS